MARVILIKSGTTGSVFQEHLEREGHEVVAVATNQFEAVATLCNQTVEADVIVTGIGLRRFPGDDAQVSAYELGKYYQQRELPVIVVSAYFSKPESWPEEMRDRVVILTDPTLGNLLSAIEKVVHQQSRGGEEC